MLSIHLAVTLLYASDSMASQLLTCGTNQIELVSRDKVRVVQLQRGDSGILLFYRSQYVRVVFDKYYIVCSSELPPIDLVSTNEEVLTFQDQRLPGITVVLRLYSNSCILGDYSPAGT